MSKKPDLSGASVQDLAFELYRRHRAGECLAIVITPEDVAEYWGGDESGATNPSTSVPDVCEMHAIGKAFERWQDAHAYAEMMQWIGEAWSEEQQRRKEASR
jgi:hypothetical protein